MNIKNVILLFSLLVLTSCGSFEDERSSLLKAPEKKDLLNSFDLSKEEAEKYKVKETSEEVKSETSLEPKIEKITKKEKKKKHNTPEKIESKVKPEIKSDSANYPEDFPALFKEYDVVSKPVWEKFKPIFYQGEQSIIAISYLGVTAGYITMTSKDIVKLGDKQAYHYSARFKSKDAYRYFYWLDDTIDSYIDKKSNLPIKYSLIQREKKQNVDDLELFDFNKLKVSTWYKRVKEGSNKDEHLEKYIPRYLQDSFSALLFVRGLPLHKGDHYDFPVSTRGDTWLLKIEVVGEETISVNDKDVLAFRLKAETHFPGVLQKSGDINFWYAADEAKRLLKFQAKVKLGSIYGELVEYKPGVLLK